MVYNATGPYSKVETPESDEPVLRRSLNPSYETNDAPYLCATPDISDYSGIILRRLRLNGKKFPIIKIHGKFQLEPTLMASWLALEHTLQCIAQNLMLSAQTALPLDYRFPSLPSECGFTSAFESRRLASLAIASSRDAFQTLVAHVSWCAILHRSRALYAKSIDGTIHWDSVHLSDLDGGWKSVLMNRSNVHPAWVNAIENSPLCDFSIQRSGLILRNPRNWIYCNLIPALVLSNVPIWLIWGPVDTLASSAGWSTSFETLYGPSDAERRGARTWASSICDGKCNLVRRIDS